MVVRSVLAVSAIFATSTSAAISTALVGTWSTKSAKVLTGPGFYNPVNDSFIEPSHTGISYSFTADGFYESAYYRAISNATTPSCPSAILQFQHGTVTEHSNGSLTLTPFAVDGRQQLSAPCEGKTSQYSRYAQAELMEKYDAHVDAYKKIQRLDLYQFDGTPIQPMYLAYNPPLMLPTVTMNPTAAPPQATDAKRRRGRGPVESRVEPLNKGAKHIQRHVPGQTPQGEGWDTADLVWWAGAGMTVLGGATYLL